METKSGRCKRVTAAPDIFVKLFFVQNSSGLSELTRSPAQDDSPASAL